MRLTYLRPYRKIWTALLLVPLLISLVPTSLLAMTSGPAQEEFASFEPAQTTEMVNLYTGDFTYNIPLMSVPGPNGGYPINLFYNSGAGMHEAGSWVGLGWNLNIGSISRQLRGLPDDFNGEEVTQEMHLKRNFAVGVDVPQPVTEFLGRRRPGGSVWNTQLYYNNYKGLGFRVSTSFGIRGIASIGINYDTQNGVGIDLSGNMSSNFRLLQSGLGLSTSFNTRQGLKGITATASFEAVGSEVKRLAVKGGSPSVLSFNFKGGVPDVRVPTKNTHIDFDLKFAENYFWPVFAVGRRGHWTGFVNWSKLVNGGKDTRRAFGYLHNQNAVDSDLKDFSRTGLPYSKKVPNLSAAAYTYDPLVATGLGMAGQFRPYRSRVEILNTPRQLSKTTGHRINLEVGVGTTLHAGLGYAQTNGEEYSGPWRGGIPSSLLEPSPSEVPQLNEPGYQDAYYQLYGEQSGFAQSEENQLVSWLNSEPLRAVFDREGNKFKVLDAAEFVNGRTGVSMDADDYTNLPTLAARNNRTPKANSLQRLTARQAYDYGFSRDLMFYPAGSNTPQPKFAGPPATGSSQISELIVHKDDGYRYVYGLPACNSEQIDATFNVYPPYRFKNNPYGNGVTPNFIDQYRHTTNRASNQFESKKTLPTYAHNWLLTHVVSPDYQDRTGDGLTNDDPGTWMKFEYTRTTGDQPSEHYQWREPYEGASFAEGQKFNPKDDMASLIYGKKELYYLKKVETATHVALFDVSTRQDARGVNNYESGGRDGAHDYNAMYKLDRIRLFVKNTDGSLPDFNTTAPQRTAVFEYVGPGESDPRQVELCPGIPSAAQGRGKLTLKSVYLTSDFSAKGELSPYRFYYNYDATDQARQNPAYDSRANDRWGKYQSAAAFNEYFPALDFPYTSQYAAPNVDAWQLKEIVLPTGGNIRVEYEPDDYAYEMDRPATQMFDVVSTDPNGLPSDAIKRTRLVDPNPDPNPDTEFVQEGTKMSLSTTDGNGNYRLYLRLTSPVVAEPSLTTSEVFKRDYLEGIDQVFYKTLANLTSSNIRSSDYVSGYAQMLTGPGQYGVVSGDPTLAYITLQAVPIQEPSFDRKIHPIRRAALTHLRTNRSEMVNGYDPAKMDPGNILHQLGNVLGGILQYYREVARMAIGFNRFAIDVKEWTQNIYAEGRTMVRLKNGPGAQYGGGSRVKTVRMSNGWTYGAGSDEYGQRYQYTIEEAGRTISSGVAITPQGIGGDESALREPVNYELSTPLLSPHNLFVEKPIMKGYYPGASVGYRKVTVQSLAQEQTGNTAQRALAPITEHEFYTHKDFPVFERETDLSSAQPIHDWAIFPLFGSKLKKHTARSQGYTIELNDMAGKPKAVTQRTFPTAAVPEGEIINRTQYRYHTDAPYTSTAANRLSNKVQLMQSDGSMVPGIIGQTHDIFHDFHENANKSNQFGLDMNLDYWQFGPFPLLAFSFFPKINLNETSLRTAVTHKVIYHTGLLKEVVVTDGQATITTANVAYDPVTAQPVLTRTTNEFKDYLYQLAEPAHYQYQDAAAGSMAGAYQNLELEWPGLTATNGFVAITGADQTFVKGDELWLQFGSGEGVKAYVLSVSALSITLIDADGQLINDPRVFDATVIRSGHRNQLTSLVANTTFRGASSLGSNDQSNLLSKNNQILSTSANTFRPEWEVLPCNDYFIRACQVGNELRALLDAIADPNRGNAGITINQDGLYNRYPGLMTPNIFFNLDYPFQAAYSPQFIRSLYIDPDFYPPLGVNEQHMIFKTASDGRNNPGCDIRLQVQNQPPGFDWSTIVGITDLWGTDPNDPKQFSVNMVDAQGNVYLANSVINSCYEICYRDASLVDGGGGGNPATRQRVRARSTTSDCFYLPEDCQASDPTVSYNPFTQGNSGAWRPHESYVYQTNRKYEENFNEGARLREYGAYETFTPFDWSGGADNTANGWVRSSTGARYTRHGEVAEERDALGNATAAQYGYGQQIAVGLGQNMYLREIAVDNFEDYNKDCTDHFRLFGAVKGHNVVDDEAHTGHYSLRVRANEEVGPYLVKELQAPTESGCQATFRPIPGETYVLSAWVKETENGALLPRATTYDQARISVNFCDGQTLLPGIDARGSGVIIDGWQRIFASFTVPPTAEYLELRLFNDAGQNTREVYFDDLRIHPEDGNMSTFVYDAQTLRLMATLDKNNYATFTIRDQEGLPVKYNVETEKGIVTLTEGTRYLKPN
ncbi:MAG: hypothetical protein AAFR05_10075 [Bacteroidota bacterium]